MPLGGIKWRDEEEKDYPKTKDKEDRGASEEKGDNNGLGPVPQVDPNAAPHVQAYQYIRQKHHHAKRIKKQYLPGMAGEIFDFFFAVLIAWLIIQLLGGVLNTSTPLVVVESESMVHSGAWEEWPASQGFDPASFGFTGGMGVGDIIVVKGDDPKDINVGDVIVYTKFAYGTVGGEPVIHRVVGTADVNGADVTTTGIVDYRENATGAGEAGIVIPCANRNSVYSIPTIKGVYSTELAKKYFPDAGKDLDDFRIFITKGDNNLEPDQCLIQTGNGAFPGISYPVHEKLLVGRSKFDIPYLGYVKLGLVCGFRYASGNVCSSRCWWPADHPSCK